jgi:ParB-like chromosome segregation protein Spo0J
MLVCGERRFRATDMIELDELPVIVRDLDDRQAFDIQCSENDKRVDVHPLEEADIFQRYRVEYGVDVEEIAELRGKSKAYVYAALKLCDLAEGPRAEFLGGNLDKSRAVLITRLPASRQDEACKAILTEGDFDEGQAARGARARRQPPWRSADAVRGRHARARAPRPDGRDADRSRDLDDMTGLDHAAELLHIEVSALVTKVERIVLTDGQLDALIERAVERGVARALSSATADRPSRSEGEERWRDDGYTYHTDTDSDGESSSSVKTAPRLWSRLEAKMKQSRQSGRTSNKSRSTRASP